MIRTPEDPRLARALSEPREPTIATAGPVSRGERQSLVRPESIAVVAFACLLSVVGAGSSWAQGGYSPFPKPPSQCRHYSVFEISQTWRLTNPRSVTYAGSSGDPINFFAFGHMVNSDADWALGGMITFGTDSDPGARVGVHIRYRRWLSDILTADVAPGISIAGGRGFDFPGLTTHASLMIGDMVGVTSVLEVSPIHGEKADVGLYAGVQIGSRIAVPLGQVLALIGSIKND